MSWTSLSMLALLLARMFIFRAITCPETRCCTWKEKKKRVKLFQKYIFDITDEEKVLGEIMQHSSGKEKQEIKINVKNVRWSHFS